MVLILKVAVESICEKCSIIVCGDCAVVLILKVAVESICGKSNSMSGKSDLI